MSDDRPCAATNEDLRRGALDHYERVSRIACDWHSAIPRAINFYFDRQANADGREPDQPQVGVSASPGPAPSAPLALPEEPTNVKAMRAFAKQFFHGFEPTPLATASELFNYIDTLRQRAEGLQRQRAKWAAEVCREQAHGVDYEPHIHFDRGTEACAQAFEREAEGK